MTRDQAESHSQIEPAIYYWGTPVVLISTENEDGTANIGPMSSAFWLLDRCMVGLDVSSQTTINMLRTNQCVLNLPSDDMTEAVNGIAMTTGTPELPPHKAMRGYRYVKDKFAAGNVTPMASELVAPPRIKECPVQMEAEVRGTYPIHDGMVLVFELKMLRTYCVDSIRMKGEKNKIDTDVWKPMIMSFCHLYGLKNGKVAESSLAEIEEESYRLPEEMRRA